MSVWHALSEVFSSEGRISSREPSRETQMFLDNYLSVARER